MLTKIVFLLGQILSLLLPFGLYSQIDSFQIDYNEASHLWTFVVCTPDFKKDTIFTNIDKYNRLYPGPPLRAGDNIYLYSRAYDENFDYFGFVLNKFNIKTGEQLWTKSNNMFNSNFQDLYHEILPGDGSHEISLLGFVRADPEKTDEIWPSYGYKSFFVKRKLNEEDEEMVVSKDTIYNDLFDLYTDCIQDSINIIHSLALEKETENSKIKLVLNTVAYDEELNRLPEYTQKVVFPDTNNLDYLSFTGGVHMRKMANHKTAILSFRDILKTDKRVSTLYLLDYSDIKNPRLIFENNINNTLPNLVFDPNSMEFDVRDNYLVLTGRYKDPNGNISRSFVSWWDSTGQIINSYLNVQYSSQVYSRIWPLKVGKSELYLLASPSRTGKSGFDLVKLDSELKQVQTPTSFTTNRTDVTLTGFLFTYFLYNDDLLLIGHRPKYTNKSEIATIYNVFDLKKVGISVATQDIHPKSKNNIHLAPNPASNLLYISCPEKEIQNLSITDVVGSLKYQTNPHQVLYNFEINIADFSPGMYYIIIEDVHQNISKSIFVKM